MKLGFIGAGEMGGAIIRGLLASGRAAQEIMASVRTVEKANLLSSTLGIAAYTDNKRLATQADWLFLAVKPAQMPQVLADIAQSAVPAKPLVSMALGWSVEKIQHVLPGWPVIRIMPNTPLGIGKGVTLFQFSGQVPERVRQEARRLFETMGSTYEIKADVFDAATAVSGSGPAFVYQFIDALTRGAEAQGLDEMTARALAVQTVRGAAALAALAEQSPAQLARQVATPGGCTAAGMEVLLSSDFNDTVKEAVAATTRKAREVASR